MTLPSGSSEVLGGRRALADDATAAFDPVQPQRPLDVARSPFQDIAHHSRQVGLIRGWSRPQDAAYARRLNDARPVAVASDALQPSPEAPPSLLHAIRDVYQEMDVVYLAVTIFSAPSSNNSPRALSAEMLSFLRLKLVPFRHRSVLPARRFTMLPTPSNERLPLA